MQKLNELVEIADDAISSDVYDLKVKVGDILAIDEAFRALEQRAADAEAKLAELERQEESRWNTHDGIARPIGVDKDDLVYLRMKRQEIKLPYPAGMVNWKHDGGEFDVIAWASVYSSPRPAPAADLADLVPDAPTGHECPEHILDPFSWACGADWFRDAILRNIKGAK